MPGRSAAPTQLSEDTELIACHLEAVQNLQMPYQAHYQRGLLKENVEGSILELTAAAVKSQGRAKFRQERKCSNPRHTGTQGTDVAS